MEGMALLLAVQPLGAWVPLEPPAARAKGDGNKDPDV